MSEKESKKPDIQKGDVIQLAMRPGVYSQQKYIALDVEKKGDSWFVKVDASIKMTRHVAVSDVRLVKRAELLNSDEELPVVETAKIAALDDVVIVDTQTPQKTEIGTVTGQETAELAQDQERQVYAGWMAAQEQRESDLVELSSRLYAALVLSQHLGVKAAHRRDEWRKRAEGWRAVASSLQAEVEKTKAAADVAIQAFVTQAEKDRAKIAELEAKLNILLDSPSGVIIEQQTRRITELEAKLKAAETARDAHLAANTKLNTQMAMMRGELPTEQKPDVLRELLAKVDPFALSPMEAHTKLMELKRKAA